MKAPKIKALLPLLGSKVTGARGPWVEGHCPFAPWNHDSGKDDHPSFAIKSSDKSKSIFKCFSCGVGGDLMDLQLMLAEKLRGHVYLNSADAASNIDLKKSIELISNELDSLEFDEDIPDYSEDAEAKGDAPYPELWLSSFKGFSAFKDATRYLDTRQGSQALYEALDVRYDPSRRRVCFPFRNLKGELMGLQGRAIDATNELRYYFYPHPTAVNEEGKHIAKNMHHWMGENHLDLDKPLVLVEGPFDYASVYRVYKNVAASFTSGISVEKLKTISDASEIITFYDYGKGGDSARKKIRKVMKNTPIIDVLCEKEEKDPGGLTKEEICYHLSPHISL